jgi:hypothetical protein
MHATLRFSIFLPMLMVLLGLWTQAQTPGQVNSGRPGRPSLHEQESNDLAEMKADIAKMQSLLNAMQANFALVGDPTRPANHELQLNIDMWRILINHMQRRVNRMEEPNSGSAKR